MANRRFGGGPNRGSRGFPQNANVNPWQGNSGPTAGVNSMGNPNLQTQLALALSSLLQPQQVNDPPSLLSLNTSSRNFNNQDNYSNRLGGNRGRNDFRRTEPYNKNQRSGGGRGGWRNEKGQNRGNSRNRPFGNNKSQGKDGGKSKADRKSSDNKASQGSAETATPQKHHDDESREDVDKKRDWKEEKNASDEKEKDDSKEAGENAEKVTKKDTTKYEGLPNSLFHCFVCNKSMWDGDSFQNHIRGKAHIQMMDSLEESFQITVKILRENMRLAEEKKMIEWSRMQRNSRKFHQRNEPESHCNMCDLKFMGKIIAHRKTEGHQRLKRFLHPNCDICNLEFPSRMEWVEHRFTPDHLFSLKEKLNSTTGNDIEGHIIEEEVEWDNDPILQESLQGEDENPVLELDDDLANLYNRVPTYLPHRPVGKNSLTKLEGFFCDICKRFLRNETDSQNHLKSEKHYHEFVSAVKDKFRANVEKDELEGNWKRKNKGGEEGAEEKEDEEKEGLDKSQDENAENGSDMYDPEEACKDEEDEDENAGEVKEGEEVEETTKPTAAVAQAEGVKAEPTASEAVVEAEVKVEAQSPNTRRRTNVRNGAGPKSKKIRKN
ncbi:zinc finger protein on ecdysone puffs [Onthophagus taurus]|uniref:zinc finger protein on ecdysone puffs n=1 Tax=Onthophagus taurus TaxID=166361 RepID=UPI0039BE7522